VRIVRDLGGQIATARQARRILKLPDALDRHAA
jgi:hypothetical protein